MKILVTGGAGSVGLALCKRLIEQGDRPVILNRDEERLKKAEHVLGRKNVDLVLGDIRDRFVVKGICNLVDYIVHLAALKHVDYVEQNPYEGVDVNIMGTLTLLEEARATGVPILFMSTDKAVEPTGLYGKTKEFGEFLIKRYKNGIILRCGNVWGSAGSVATIWEQEAKKGYVSAFQTGHYRWFIQPKELTECLIKIINGKGVYFGKTIVPEKLKNTSMDQLERDMSEKYGVPLKTMTNYKEGEKAEELLFLPDEKVVRL